jgi:hypothetical protein
MTEAEKSLRDSLSKYPVGYTTEVVDGNTQLFVKVRAKDLTTILYLVRNFTNEKSLREGGYST